MFGGNSWELLDVNLSASAKASKERQNIYDNQSIYKQMFIVKNLDYASQFMISIALIDINLCTKVGSCHSILRDFQQLLKFYKLTQRLSFRM